MYIVLAFLARGRGARNIDGERASICQRFMIPITSDHFPHVVTFSAPKETRRRRSSELHFLRLMWVGAGASRPIRSPARRSFRKTWVLYACDNMYPRV
eukprot:9488920-Pyramimonas_sp.AAC.1